MRSLDAEVVEQPEGVAAMSSSRYGTRVGIPAISRITFGTGA